VCVIKREEFAMSDPSQLSIDRGYPGEWTVTFSNPPINMFVPATILELDALMTDLETDSSVKAVVFQSANPDFFVAHLDVAKALERPTPRSASDLSRVAVRWNGSRAWSAVRARWRLRSAATISRLILPSAMAG
jgi:enoyl-CoA hydratase/carnithine racemase